MKETMLAIRSNGNQMLGKARALMEKAEGVALGLYIALMISPESVFCTGFLKGSMEEISINTSVEPQTVVNRLITVIAGLFVIVGLFKVATSAFAILEAYSEDNSAAVNKSTKQLGIGAAFIAAPLLIAWLLGS